MESAKKWESLAERGELLFKLLFLLNGFLQNCNLTYDKIIVSIVQWPAVGLGAVLILYRLIFFRSYRNTKGLWLLVLFTLSYAVSTLVMIRYGWYDNVRMMIFMVFQFGILYAFDINRPAEKTEKEFRIASVLYLICIGILSLLSFAFLFCGYDKVIYTEGYPSVCFGFLFGRLFGAYWDVNIGAVLAAVSVPLSVLFLTRKPKCMFKALLVGNIVLQIFFVAYSGSRSGTVTLCCAVFFLLIFRFLHWLRTRSGKKLSVAAITGLLTLILLITVSLPTATKAVGNLTLDLYGRVCVLFSEPDEEIMPLKISRSDEVVTKDITNRRKDIWKNAVEIWKDEPLFGTSRNGILPYAREHMPDCYIVSNDYIPFSSMHNIVFDVLVSQGLFGLIPFITFAVYIVVFLLRRWRNIMESQRYTHISVWISVFLMVCLSSMVMTEIVYVISPISTIAWISLSALVKTLSAEPIRTELPVEEKHE